MRIARWSVTLMLCAAAGLMMAGCGGGGSGLDYDPATTGTVTGRIVDINSSVGVEGTDITIQTRSGSSGSIGEFEVRGVPGGTHLITVDPPDPYVMINKDPIYVEVTATEVTTLDNIYVVPEGCLPPDPE